VNIGQNIIFKGKTFSPFLVFPVFVERWSRDGEEVFRIVSAHKAQRRRDSIMRKDYGPMPKTREEAILIAMSIRDEDIDLPEMPESGGVTEWRRGNERTTAKDQFIDRASVEDMKRGCTIRNIENIFLRK
jgi:hypothetical protein